ncbi:hypothetical protein I6F34_42065 [Bradyrhizobium sp. BRP05]|nr:hypothetical protein [Bradyrhizobium sp. BRP05]
MTDENISEKKAQIIEVNANYPQVKYLGIINIEDKLFLRTSLTAPLSKITPLKMEILDKYYEK